jgi:CopA family copper-resistance protein
MSTTSDKEAVAAGNPGISRRRFVQGVAFVGAAASVGVRPGFAAGLTDLRAPEVLQGNDFDLTVRRQAINLTGRQSWSNTINGGVPGPVLRWREGDVVTIRLKNEMPEATGFHWHGIILPNDMDGVPGLEFAGIQPGTTYHYQFPVLQSGTYWYHSHMGYQEQKGAYGALIIDPAGPPTIQADREHIILISDWTDDDPTTIASNFKQMSEYYNYNKRTTATDIADVRNSGLMTTIKERARWARMRMDPTGLEAPTGINYTYLVNGFPPAANWTALFKPGERVRLRFINASAATYYDVRIPGLKMSVVHVHGNDVEPVPVDEFRIAVAETYDVIVEPTEDHAYTVFIQDLGRTGYARATLSPRDGMKGEVPPMDDRPMRGMADMGMAKMMPNQIGASHKDRNRIGGITGKSSIEVASDIKLLPGHQPMMMRPDVAKAKPGVEQQFVAKMLIDRLNTPGDGLNHLHRRSLTYGDLRARKPGVDPRPPTRELVLRLTGNMNRFIWGFNGKKYTEVGPIDVTLGERFRLRMINDTMMSHPIHLHGMWMELENGGGTHQPYLHTVNVQPAESLSVLITPVATGQWALHCHILYHFEAGMFRTVRVLPKEGSDV